MQKVDPVKLVEALTKQADNFATASSNATTDATVTINTTVAMTLFALSTALATAVLETEQEG